MRRRRRDSLLEALHAFRALTPEINVNQILAFLYTCENEGLSVQELAFVAGLSQSAASRNLRALGRPESGWSIDPALGLVEPFQRASDGRSHVLHLTPAGEALRERLDEIIRRAVPIRPD
jgi:DNA-binding MarR family transcriptional regulator